MTKKEYLDSLVFECPEREVAHRLTVASLAWDAANLEAEEATKVFEHERLSGRRGRELLRNALDCANNERARSVCNQCREAIEEFLQGHAPANIGTAGHQPTEQSKAQG